MALPGFIRKLSYQTWFIRTIRGLGLRGPGRKIYHRFASSQQGVVHLERGGITADFVTRAPEELRAAEAASLEHSLDLFIRSLKPGDTVYDIGSNVGVYTVFLAKVVGDTGSIIAFEPHPATYQLLLENIKLNGLLNVRPFQKAVGERNSQEKLYIGELIANYSLLAGGVESRGGQSAPPFQIVEVVAGDAFAQAQGLPAPCAVKIDVEGFEYAVMKGLRQALSNPGCRMVCCEVHPKFLPPEVKAKDIRDFLASLGYQRMEGEPSESAYHLVAYRS